MDPATLAASIGGRIGQLKIRKRSNVYQAGYENRTKCSLRIGQPKMEDGSILGEAPLSPKIFEDMRHSVAGI